VRPHPLGHPPWPSRSSPLTLLWSRIAVSDALFQRLPFGGGCCSAQCWQKPRRPGGRDGLVLGLRAQQGVQSPWWLAGLTLLGLRLRQGGLAGPCLATAEARAGPGPQACLCPLPCVAAMLVVEGRPFWDRLTSGLFHNLQRFSSFVVQRHLQPWWWWYFPAGDVVPSLPFTPLLGLGLARGLRDGARQGHPGRGWQRAPGLLQPFIAAASAGLGWLLAVWWVVLHRRHQIAQLLVAATPAAARD